MVELKKAAAVEEPKFVRIKHWVPKDKVQGNLSKSKIYTINKLELNPEKGYTYCCLKEGVNIIVSQTMSCVYLSYIVNGWVFCDENGTSVPNPYASTNTVSSSEISVKDAVSKSLKEISNKGGLGGMSSFGYIDTKGQVNRWASKPCIADLDNMRSPKVVFSWYKTAENGEASREFLYWLTCKESPWASIVPTQDKFKDKFPKEIFDFDFRHDYGFVFPNIDVIPANALANFLIASRLPWEYPQKASLWYDLSMDGCDPTAAYFFLGMYEGTKEKDAFTLTTNEGGHWPLCYSYAHKDVLENFCKGKFCHTSKPLTKGGKYRPCNVLWYSWGEKQPTAYGYDNVDSKDNYVKFFEATYKDTLKEGKEGKSTFVNNTKRISYETLKELINLETKRIKGHAG